MTRVSAYGYSASSTPVIGSAGVAVVPAGQSVAAGGMDYEEEPRRCEAIKRDGERCGGFSVGGGTLCIGHRNAKEKQERAVDGSVDTTDD